jgi:non-specific serine/threonine protein kinase
MGEVYLARDPRLEREVALKMLPAEFAKDPDRMARFRREALAIAAINHPNIATVFGFEETSDGEPMLVLERVEGETLADRLHRGAPETIEALRIGLKIAEALEAAHRRGVIHRDLKPANVMLGPGGVVKVLDFGVALTAAGATAAAPPAARMRAFRPGAAPDVTIGDDTPTSSPVAKVSGSGSGDSSGTPGYMSPEQVRGEAQDERTDVFAFGCVLFECLSGRRAFSGATGRELTTAVLTADPAFERLPAKIPTRARSVIERCLEKDASARPGSMRDVRIELEEAMGIRRASALRAGEAEAAVPNNLPRQTTSFVGRERALADCRELQRSARLLTLTGVGGSGKTRLALQLAEGLVSEYPDGLWFLDLAPLTDPDRVPQAAAASMGIAEESDRPILETLVRALATRRVLIVLDNCEHLLDASARLAVTLLEAAPELRIVATSREGLGVRGEQSYAVPSLSLPGADEARDPQRAAGADAVRLFVERAALVVRDFALTRTNAPVVAEICRRLDGIPLAIELAAARVRMLSAEQILDKLNDRFRLLTGGGKAALPRHQTLRAAMQWSYDLLAADERELLRTLSVFAGGWTLEAATSVCGRGRDDFAVLDSLTRLEDKSLIVVERFDDRPPRYRFLETVRQYGRELLVGQGESDALRHAHRDWFLAFAENAAGLITGPDQAQWLDRMDDERDNLRSAMDWCLEREKDIDLAVRLAAAMQWWWLIRGYIYEGRERLEALLPRTDRATPTPILASVMQAAGNMCFRLDDYEAARVHYERALALREQIGDTRGVAGSLGALGNVAQYQGRFAEARDLFERSLVINRESGNKVWEATNLTCLGNCSRYAGDPVAARSYLEQAVELNREIGNRNGEAYALDGLGTLTLEAGDTGAARGFLERALAIEREIGDEHEQAVTLGTLARVAIDERDLALARARYAEAIRVMHRLGARLQIAGCLDGLARIALLEVAPKRAVRLCSAAQALRHAVGVPTELEADGQREAISAARAMLAPDVFEVERARGEAMSLEEAIMEGLGEALTPDGGTA